MKAARGGASAYIALLRGVNVGGKNLLPMKDLAEMFAQCECVDVKTYIQSGNVVFRASPGAAKKLAAKIAESIQERFGFESPVILRTPEEMRAALDNNPFATVEALENTVHIMFLADLPDAAAIASLDPDRSPPDRFAVRGREIYLHVPNGMGRSKLTNGYFDRKLSTVSTARNWRTVLKLLEMAGG